MIKIFGHVPAVARGGGILDKLSINLSERGGLSIIKKTGFEQWKKYCLFNAIERQYSLLVLFDTILLNTIDIPNQPSPLCTIPCSSPSPWIQSYRPSHPRSTLNMPILVPP